MFKQKKLKPHSKPMSVKKAEYKKKNKKRNIFWFILWIIATLLIVGVWGIIVASMEITSPNFETLKKFKETTEEYIAPTAIDWKINIMLIWKWGEAHNDAGDLTDTIILASVNKNLDTVSMFSIPRDMYVEFENWGEWKINDIYFKAKKRGKTHKEAILELKRKVSEITGEQIPYYLMIDFQGFVDVVDALWGIEIDVPKSINDPLYPDNNYGYQTFKINAGLQTLDWDTALKYARSRKTTSDFDRSIRQQLIIRAIKDKVESMWFLTSPKKIRGLYLWVKNNFDTNFEVTEIISMGLYAKDIGREKIKTFNLNDSCYYGDDKCVMGGFMYYPIRADFDNLSVTLPYGSYKWNLSNYDTIQRYTNLIFNYPELYEENTQINVFNWTRIGGLAWKYANRLKRYGFNIPSENSIWNARDQVYKNSVIYYNWISVDAKTLEALSLFIFWEQVKTEAMKFSEDDKTRIEIVIWEDFNTLTF